MYTIFTWLKSVNISFLVLSIKCVISCLTFFELSLLSVCSSNNSANVLKESHLCWRCRLCSSSSYFLTLQIVCSGGGNERGFPLLCTGHILVQCLDLFYSCGLLASCPVFRHIIFDAPLLDVKFRCETVRVSVLRIL